MSTDFFLPSARLQLLQLQLMTDCCDAPALAELSANDVPSANSARNHFGTLLAEAPANDCSADMDVRTLLRKFLDDFSQLVDLGERKLSSLICYVRWCGLEPTQWPRQLEAQRVLIALPWRQEFAYSATQALILMLLTGMRKAAVAVLRDQLPRARHGWVFPSQQGGPIQSIYHVWREALRMAGLKPCVPHVARHTIASLLKKHGGKFGVGTKQISALMRHLNERTTEMVYQHVQATDENLYAADVYALLVGEQEDDFTSKRNAA